MNPNVVCYRFERGGRGEGEKGDCNKKSYKYRKTRSNDFVVDEREGTHTNYVGCNKWTPQLCCNTCKKR